MKNTLLAIDPGKRSIAWAFFVDNSLHRVGFVSSKKKQEACLKYLLDTTAERIGLLVNTVVVEVPRIYPRDRVHRVNDLIDLSLTAGACTLLGERAHFVHPITWKGAVPKEIMTARILKRLPRRDQDLLGEYRSNHNVIDAIGIGLWWISDRHR